MILWGSALAKGTMAGLAFFALAAGAPAAQAGPNDEIRVDSGDVVEVTKPSVAREVSVAPRDVTKHLSLAAVLLGGAAVAFGLGTLALGHGHRTRHSMAPKRRHDEAMRATIVRVGPNELIVRDRC